MGSERDPSGGVQPYMYAAMLALREKDFDGAERCITSGRLALAPVLGGMLDEAYSRAYGEAQRKKNGRGGGGHGRRGERWKGLWLFLVRARLRGFSLRVSPRARLCLVGVS